MKLNTSIRQAPAAGLLLLPFLALFQPAGLPAATKDWRGTSSSDWNTAGNWNGGVPGAGDSALFGMTTGQNALTNTIDLGGGAVTLGSSAANTSAATSALRFGSLGTNSYTVQNGTLTLGTTGNSKTYGFLVTPGVTLNLNAATSNQVAGKGILFSAGNGAVLNIQASAALNDRFGFVASDPATGTAATVNINAPNWAAASYWLIGTDALSLNTGTLLPQNLTVNVNANQATSSQWNVGYTAAGYENAIVIRNGASVTHSGDLVLGGLNQFGTDTSSGRLQVGDAATSGSYTANSTGTSTSVAGYSGTAITSLRLGVGAGTGTVDINNGILTLSGAGTVVLGYGNQASSKGVINLNSNGVIITKASFGRTATGSGILNFNGGTLKLNSGIGATQSANLVEPGVTANVLDGGAVFDLNGKSATLNAPLLVGGSGVGGLTLKNTGTGGTLTLAAQNSISGSNTVSGATLRIAGTAALQGSTTISGGTVSVDSGGALYAANLLVGLNASSSTNIAAAGAVISVGSGAAHVLRVGYRTSPDVGASGVLDVSALSNFTANVGNVSVGYNTASGGSTFASGKMVLATNNTITATAAFLIGSSAGSPSGVTNLVLLGSGANAIATPVLTVGGPKENGALLLNPGGTLTLNNGSARANLNVGLNNVATSVTTSNLCDLSGGSFVASLGTVTVGAKSGGSTAGTSALLALGSSPANEVDADSLVIGSLAGGASGAQAGRGTLSFGGGTFLVNSNVLLANLSGANGTAQGTLSITGGRFQVAGDILDGGGFSTVNVNNGVLDLQPEGDPTPGNLSVDTLSLNGTIAHAGNITVTDFSGRGTLAGQAGVTTVLGTLAPGDANPGTLTLNGALVLGATTLIKWSKTADTVTNDLVKGVTSLTYGGSLVLTNVGTSPLSGGETLKMFDASSFSGSFTNLSLPALGPDLNWWAGNLAVDGSLTVNRAPTAGTATYTRAPGLSLKIRVADLLGHASDPDGNPLVLQAVGPSSLGATVVAGSDYVFYTPVTGASSNTNDSFSYTVADGRGGSRQGLVQINVTAVAGGAQQVSLTGGSARLTFSAIPGYAYAVQRSTNLLTWQVLYITNAPTTGQFTVLDNFSDLGGLPAAAYYRLAQP